MQITEGQQVRVRTGMAIWTVHEVTSSSVHLVRRVRNKNVFMAAQPADLRPVR